MPGERMSAGYRLTVPIQVRAARWTMAFQMTVTEILPAMPGARIQAGYHLTVPIQVRAARWTMDSRQIISPARQGGEDLVIRHLRAVRRLLHRHQKNLRPQVRRSHPVR